MHNYATAQPQVATSCTTAVAHYENPATAIAKSSCYQLGSVGLQFFAVAATGPQNTNNAVDARVSQFCFGSWHPHRNRKGPPYPVLQDATTVYCSSTTRCTIRFFEGAPGFPAYCHFGESSTSPQIHFNGLLSHATHCTRNTENFFGINSSSQLPQLLSPHPLTHSATHTHADPPTTAKVMGAFTTDLTVCNLFSRLASQFGL